MITNMRRGAKSPLFLALLALIAVAFVITGIGTPGGGVGGGLGAASLASVDGEDITVAEVTDAVERRLEAARREQPGVEVGQLVAAGAVEQTIGALISQKALSAFADAAGMSVSKAMVDGEIASMPAFFDLNGKFSEDIYRERLQAQRVTDVQLREDLHSAALQKQLLIPAGASARTPRGVAAPYAAMLLESRSGEVGIVPADSGSPAPAATPAELEAFFRQNRARYVVPERRVLRYAIVGAENAGVAAPSDAEIEAAYKARAAEFADKEIRVLSQIVLPDQNAARAIAARIAGGQSFVAAAAGAGFSAGDISVGPQEKAAFARLTSPTVADRAFALGKGAVSEPLRSPLGFHIVKVDDVRVTPGRPLAAVRGELAAGLAKTRTAEALAALVEQIDKEIGDGASFGDVAGKRKLAVVQTPEITASGIAPGQPGFRAPAELSPLLPNAFAGQSGEDPTLDAIPGTDRYAMVAVDRVIPAAPPPLATIRDQVAADLKAKRAADRARAVAAAIVAKVNAGTPMAKAFADAGIRIGAPRAISARRLDVARANKAIPPPIQLLFSLPKGRARLLPAPGNAGFFVVHLADIVPGNAATSPGLIEVTRTQFSQIAGQEYVEQFLGAVRRGAKVVEDKSAIARLKSQLDGTAARTR